MGKTLPYDAEIEYLESSGTQAIDTGYKNFASTMMLWTDIQFTETSVRQIAGSSDCFLYGVNNGKWEASYQKYYGTADTQRHIFYKKITKLSNTLCKEEVFLDSTKIHNGNTNHGAGRAVYKNVCLFSSINDSDIVRSIGWKAKVFACKLYIDEILVRDFIPVRVGTTGYMYDKVSGGLFGNAGTGDFILGNDVN